MRKCTALFAGFFLLVILTGCTFPVREITIHTEPDNCKVEVLGLLEETSPCTIGLLATPCSHYLLRITKDGYKPSHIGLCGTDVVKPADICFVGLLFPLYLAIHHGGLTKDLFELRPTIGSAEFEKLDDYSKGTRCIREIKVILEPEE